MLQVHLPLMRRGFAAEDAWQAFIDVGEVQPCNSTAAPSCTAVTRGIPPLPLICPLTNSMHGVGRLCSCCLLKLSNITLLQHVLLLSVSNAVADAFMWVHVFGQA